MEPFKYIDGDCTLKLYSPSNAHPQFLSSLEGGKAQFYATKRENALHMAEGDAHRLCAILRGEEVKCYVVWAEPET